MSKSTYKEAFRESAVIAGAAMAKIDELRAQLDACAAGPWRFDVENAPKDGSEAWCRFEEVGTELQVSAGWSNDHHAWLDGFGRSYDDAMLRAFAVPNPPQVKP